MTAGGNLAHPGDGALNIVDTLSTKRLCFTVTSGRSGTKLLAELLRGGAGICAEHEPAPRFNYVLRSILDCPEAARWWLETEKLPAMAERVGAETAYAETSHLTCKGFIEPLLELGLRPVLLFVARPARDVARSLFKIGAIPERTPSGRLVLIGPAHSPFLRVADWENWTDYQLCYWYAREIERRQGYYRKLASRVGLEWFDCPFDDIRDWDRFVALSEFVSGSTVVTNPDAFHAILQRNQNPREALLNGSPERGLPDDLDAQEQEVEDQIAEIGSHQLNPVGYEPLRT